MNNFLTIENLQNYAMFITAVFTMTAFIKDIKYIKKIKTKYVSFLISFILMLVFKISGGTFNIQYIMLDIINSILISVGAGGLHDLTDKSESSFFTGESKTPIITVAEPPKNNHVWDKYENKKEGER